MSDGISFQRELAVIREGLKHIEENDERCPLHSPLSKHATGEAIA